MKISSLKQAKANVNLENPNLPMKLRFEVSDQDVIKRLLEVEDLTLATTKGQRNIIGKIFDQVLLKLSENNFRNVTTVRDNPIVLAEDNFDNLLFTLGNPGRSATYTRYVDENSVLRTHTSALIPKQFRLFATQQLKEPVTLVLPGLVYRRDVIDPKHLDAFHQIDIWTLQKTAEFGKSTREDLLNLVKVVFSAACPDAEMVYYEAKHPYTLDGIEVYAKTGDQEIEVLECGLIHPGVLSHAGLNPNEYSGLALGMGIERLVMARKFLPDIRLIRSSDPRVVAQMQDMSVYIPVSDQPAISRDMSYCVYKDDTEEDICEDIKRAFGVNSHIIERVTILERVSHDKLQQIAIKKLGATRDMDNVLVRITLRHPDETLTKVAANSMYLKAYPLLHKGTTPGYTT